MNAQVNYLLGKFERAISTPQKCQRWIWDEPRFAELPAESVLMELVREVFNEAGPGGPEEGKLLEEQVGWFFSTLFRRLGKRLPGDVKGHLMNIVRQVPPPSIP